MPWLHVPEAMLARFVSGELDEDQAVQVALHVDDCPACRARAAAAEPLQAAFAAAVEVEPPAALMEAIVAQAATSSRGADTTTPVVVAGLAAAAVAVLVLAGAPGEVLAGLGGLASAFGAVLRAVELPVAAITPIWLAAAMFTFAAATMTARRLEVTGAA